MGDKLPGWRNDKAASPVNRKLCQFIINASLTLEGWTPGHSQAMHVAQHPCGARCECTLRQLPTIGGHPHVGALPDAPGRLQRSRQPPAAECDGVDTTRSRPRWPTAAATTTPRGRGPQHNKASQRRVLVARSGAAAAAGHPVARDGSSITCAYAGGGAGPRNGQAGLAFKRPGQIGAPQAWAIGSQTGRQRDGCAQWEWGERGPTCATAAPAAAPAPAPPPAAAAPAAAAGCCSRSLTSHTSGSAALPVPERCTATATATAMPVWSRSCYHTQEKQRQCVGQQGFRHSQLVCPFEKPKYCTAHCIMYILGNPHWGKIKASSVHGTLLALTYSRVLADTPVLPLRED